MPKFGPTGEAVYTRTYQRPKPNGERETFDETIARVVDGNLGLVPSRHIEAGEREALIDLFGAGPDGVIKALPAGRHLWASGVPGRQFLFNCHVAGWGEAPSSHFEFTFMRLMEGGGVGANYSSKFLEQYGPVQNCLEVVMVCDPSHPDYEKMKSAGILSDAYTSDWPGAFEVDDSREGWAAALTDLIDTYWRNDVKHVQRVYDVTNVRPEGARLKTFGGSASGPMPFAAMMLEIGRILNTSAAEFWESKNSHMTPLEAMEIDHAIASCVVAGGNRRSARMAMLPWNDPAILEFIACKQDTGKHWTTNISVVIDDDFMNLLALPRIEDDPWMSGNLAHDVHEAVVTGMLTNGEPGYWNYSLSQRGEVNEVVATNPCGEITLEPWENCNLGHVNLDAFVRDKKPDYVGMFEAHRLMARFLIRATYGDVTDPKQGEVLARNRRIGVGHFGVQGYLVKQGIRYSHAPKAQFFTQDLRTMREVVRNAAREYAFDLRIPEPVKVTTVAPTGTIAKMPGTTEGIHPVLFRHFIRRVRFSVIDPEQYAQVQGYMAQGYKVEDDVYDTTGNTVVVEFPTKESLVAEVEALGYPADMVESADEIALADLLAFQAMYQTNYADNAVSFTANVQAEPHQAAALAAGESVPAPSPERVAEVSAVIARMLPRLKGTTIMLDGARPQAPYERLSEAEYETATNKTVADGLDDECMNGACPVR